MNDVILASIITGSISLIGSISTLLAQSRLTQYRIRQLEEKVGKHNNLVERMVIVEQSTKSAHHRLDEMNMPVGR